MKSYRHCFVNVHVIVVYHGYQKCIEFATEGIHTTAQGSTNITIHTKISMVQVACTMRLVEAFIQPLHLQLSSSKHSLIPACRACTVHILCGVLALDKLYIYNFRHPHIFLLSTDFVSV